jgi:uncharacterized membrane protein
LWGNFGILLLVFIVLVALTLPNAIPILGIIYSIFVGWPLQYGANYVMLRAARDEEIQVGHLFEGFKCYGSALLACLLVSLIVLGGLILLIVPGIIFACKLAFVPFLVVERKMGATDAIGTSWRMTRGHALTVFLIGLVSIPIVFAGLLCLLVGVIPAVMWVGITLAALYHAVSAKEAAAPPSQQPA